MWPNISIKENHFLSRIWRNFLSGRRTIIFEFLTILLSSRIHTSQGCATKRKYAVTKCYRGSERERGGSIISTNWGELRQHLQCLIINPHYLRDWAKIHASPLSISDGIAEALHIGHQFFCLSHSWMQHTWYWCSHCILPSSSPSTYSSCNIMSVSVRNAGCRKNNHPMSREIDAYFKQVITRNVTLSHGEIFSEQILVLFVGMLKTRRLVVCSMCNLPQHRYTFVSFAFGHP